MSINNNFFQDEIFDTENFENSYYFPPVFSSSDDLVSNDVLDHFRSESIVDSDIDIDIDINFDSNQGLDRLDASGSLMGLGVNPATSQAQPTVADLGYIQAYLKTQIGKFVRIEFLIGTNVLTDRSGILSQVGINYIVLTDASGAKVMADLYSIKFVTTATTSGGLQPNI